MWVSYIQTATVALVECCPMPTQRRSRASSDRPEGENAARTGSCGMPRMNGCVLGSGWPAFLVHFSADEMRKHFSFRPPHIPVFAVVCFQRQTLTLQPRLSWNCLVSFGLSSPASASRCLDSMQTIPSSLLSKGRRQISLFPSLLLTWDHFFPKL